MIGALMESGLGLDATPALPPKYKSERWYCTLREIA